MVICKNCGNKFKGNFCNQCGQSAETYRLNFKFLLHDIQHGLFHFDKGILHSIKQLCIRPGHTVNEYIAGKRVSHFKPLSMVVVLATLYGLLKHFFLHEIVSGSSKIIINDKTINSATINSIFEWVNSHGAIMALLIVPFYSLASFIAYRKEKYNFAEHLVLNAYTSSLRLIVTIILFPLIMLTQHSAGNNIADVFITILEVIVTCWCFMQFFSNIKWSTALKKLMYTYLIFFSEMIVVGAVLVVIILFFIYLGKI